MAEHREPTAPSVDRLIARLEKATEGSRELSWAIAEHLGWARIWCGHTVFIGPGEWADKARRDPMSVSVVDLPGDIEAGPAFPNYTRSVDAALTLLPEGWWLQHLGHNLAGWGARVERQGVSLPPSMRLHRSPTPALAVCIPALIAHATVPPTGHVELGEQPNTDPQQTTAAASSAEAERPHMLDGYGMFKDSYYPDRAPSPPAVVDHTERAQELRRKIREKYETEDPTWRSPVSRYSLREDQADDLIVAALSAVASEHQDALADARHEAAQNGAAANDMRQRAIAAQEECATLKHDIERYQAIASSEAAGHSEALAGLEAAEAMRDVADNFVYMKLARHLLYQLLRDTRARDYFTDDQFDERVAELARAIREHRQASAAALLARLREPGVNDAITAKLSERLGISYAAWATAAALTIITEKLT